MSAEELRQAAETLRERANKATCWPWESFHHNERPDEAIVAYEGDLSLALCEEEHEPKFTDGDAAYIATMHPGVGLALADPLNVGAEGACCDECISDPAADPFRNQMLTIARLINGGAS